MRCAVKQPYRWERLNDDILMMTLSLINSHVTQPQLLPIATRHPVIQREHAAVQHVPPIAKRPSFTCAAIRGSHPHSENISPPDTSIMKRLGNETQTGVEQSLQEN